MYRQHRAVILLILGLLTCTCTVVLGFPHIEPAEVDPLDELPEHDDQVTQANQASEGHEENSAFLSENGYESQTRDDDLSYEPADQFETASAPEPVHDEHEYPDLTNGEEIVHEHGESADARAATQPEETNTHATNDGYESTSQDSEQSTNKAEGQDNQVYYAGEVESADDNTYLENLVAIAENAMRIERNGAVALRYFRAAGVLGHGGALASAASLLLSGDIGVKRDVGKAIRYLRLAASVGQSDAQSFLGMLHASGLGERYGVEKSAAKAVLYWQFASEMRNTYAATALGFRYYTGLDVGQDCRQAASHYYLAAKEVARDPATWPSWRNFMFGLPPLPSKLRSPGSERLSDDGVDRVVGNTNGGGRGRGADTSGEDDVLHYYRHSAARGNLEAQTTIGALQYFGGHGMPRDEQGAEAQLSRAAVAGSGDANAMLAHIKMRRNDDPESIVDHFQRAASQGNKHGHYGLGMIYLYGMLNQGRDYAKARQHFTLAMDAQHGEAAFHLGRMHTKGLGVNKSRDEAFRHFQIGARWGNVQCEYAMGVYFLNGLGPVPEPDCASAVPFFKLVAEKGDWRGVFDAGATSLNKGDVFGALHRFTQAAHAGIELGQYNAALVLEKVQPGNVSEISHWNRARIIDEARVLYTMSAKQGYSSAVVRAGNLAFLEKKDYTQAVRAYELGYRLKNAEATFCLGWMYVRGLGVPHDRHLALRYLNSALDANSKEAAVPVSVALMGLRTWWAARDLATKLGFDGFVRRHVDSVGKALWAQVDSLELYARRGGEVRVLDEVAGAALSKENRDIALVVALLIVLLAVVTLRKRRLISDDVDDLDHLHHHQHHGNPNE